MGTQEVATYLGWPTGRVSDYARKGTAGIPAAFAHLGCGRIWLRSEIEDWARRRDYKAQREGRADDE